MISALSYLRGRPVRSGPTVALPWPAAEWHLAQFRPFASKNNSSPLRASPEWLRANVRRASTPVDAGLAAKTGSEGSGGGALNDHAPLPRPQRRGKRFLPLALRTRAAPEPGAVG